MKKLFALSFCLFVALASATAAVLVQYDLAGPNSNADLPYSPDFVAGDMNAGDLFIGPGLTGYSNQDPGYYAATGWPLNFDANLSHMMFSVTPNSGYQFNFDALKFSWEMLSFFAPPNLRVRSSIDNFTSDLYSTTFPTFPMETHQITVPLSHLPAQTDRIYFAIYAYGQGDSGTGGLAGLIGASQGGSPLLLEGTVSVIPEPSTWALAILGFALMASRFARNRR